jgi:hypothetical protein
MNHETQKKIEKYRNLIFLGVIDNENKDIMAAILSWNLKVYHIILHALDLQDNKQLISSK